MLIGAIAVAVIGLAGYVFWEPGRGTIEWHKKKYLKAFERLSRTSDEDNIKVMEEHLSSLLELGYVQTARVSLTNTLAWDAIRAAYSGPNADECFGPYSAAYNFVFVDPDGDYGVNIVAPASRLRIVEAAIRQADVPEPK